jgi:hypothetical protein
VASEYRPRGFLGPPQQGYAVLVNTLPRIFQGEEDPHIVQQVRDILIGHAGWLQDTLRSRLLQLVNPVQWIIRGLEVPGRFLAALRVVSPSVGEGPVLRLITLVSVVLTILAMWDPATAFLRSHGIIP